MREACVELPCSSQPLLDLPSHSLGVHGEVKIGLGQSRFKGRNCLAFWLADAGTLIPSGESAGDLSNKVVTLAGASGRSSGEAGVQFPRSVEALSGL